MYKVASAFQSLDRMVFLVVMIPSCKFAFARVHMGPQTFVLWSRGDLQRHSFDLNLLCVHFLYYCYILKHVLYSAVMRYLLMTMDACPQPLCIAGGLPRGYVISRAPHHHEKDRQGVPERGDHSLYYGIRESL